MKIAIFGRNLEEEYREDISLFFKIITSQQCNVYIFKPFFDYLKTIPDLDLVGFKEFVDHEEIKSDFNFFFSIGGDGTFLESVRYVRNSGVPIIGINTGRLGFLANIGLSEIDDSLKALFSGEYQLENRSLIEFKTNENPFTGFSYALNEITVQKHDTSLITIESSISGHEINTYWADGLIISTPTGSTAYSMSTGGPIVSPDCNVLIISPIASHNLTVRPLVITDKQEIDLKVYSRSGTFMATIDSQSHIFSSGASIHLKLAPFQVQIVRLNHHTFFKTIRKKLMWGADIRN